MTAEQDRTDAAEIPDEWVDATARKMYEANHEYHRQIQTASGREPGMMPPYPPWAEANGYHRDLYRVRARAALAAVYPLIRDHVSLEFARMVTAAKSAEGRVKAAEEERDALAAAVLALADEWDRYGFGVTNYTAADHLRAVVGAAGVEAAARVKAQALREAEDEWEGGPTGQAPIPRYWLRGRADALDADTGSAT